MSVLPSDVSSVNDRGIMSYRQNWDRLGSDYPPIVFVHGSLDRGSSFRKTVKMFSDHPVITYDRVGYGASTRTRPVSDRPLDDQVHDLLSVLPDVPVIAATHSFGGAVALRAVLDHPDRFLAVAMFEPPVTAADEDPTSDTYRSGLDRIAAGSPADVAERAFRRIMGSDIWELLPDATQQQCRDEGVGYLADIACYYNDVPQLTRNGPLPLLVPVTIGHGSDDHNRYPMFAALLQSLLPNSSLLAYPDTPHHAHLARPHFYVDLVTAATAVTQRVDGCLPPAEIMERWQPGSGTGTWDEEHAAISNDRVFRGMTKTVTHTKQVRTPVMVGDDGRVWDGHHRILVAADIGVPAVPYRIMPPT